MDICFWCRKNDATSKSGKASIYCTITVNGIECVPFSTNVRVVAAKWNTKAKTTKDEFQDIVRQELNEVESKLRRIKLDLEDSADIVTAELIKSTYLSLRAAAIKPVKKKKEIRFFELFRIHINEKAQLGAKGQTQENNLVMYNNIYKYFKSVGKPNIRLKEIDFEVIEQFSFYMRTVRKISINHTNTHISIIRKILDMAVIRKIILSNPIAPLKLKYSDNFDPKGLDIQEVEKIESVQPKSDFEEIVIDIFLFLCGTGIDYCDYIKLTNDNLREKKGKYLLRHERQKTDTYTTDEISEGNPILKPCAVRILEKYGSIDKLPKVKNLQNINRAIQVVAKRLEIKLHLTTKRGRKTFSNISVNKDKHTDEQTAYQLGHSSTKQLKHYRKYNDSILEDLL